MASYSYSRSLKALLAVLAIVFLGTFVVFLRVAQQIDHSTSSSSVAIQSTSRSKMSLFESMVRSDFIQQRGVTINASSSSAKRLSSLTTLRNANNDDQRSPSSSSSALPRVLVIYFPQYHPDPLNDKNWGENFTDWVSLRNSASKNRLGYGIPRPTELGYYDLRDKEPRQKQGELAKQYGIDGFIYHHYWFYDPTHPGPNLEKPLVNMLQDGDPDIPFLLNW
jgi:hypothetical protein